MQGVTGPVLVSASGLTEIGGSPVAVLLEGSSPDGAGHRFVLSAATEIRIGRKEVIPVDRAVQRLGTAPQGLEARVWLENSRVARVHFASPKARSS